MMFSSASVKEDSSSISGGLGSMKKSRYSILPCTFHLNFRICYYSALDYVFNHYIALIPRMRLDRSRCEKNTRSSSTQDNAAFSADAFLTFSANVINNAASSSIVVGSARFSYPRSRHWSVHCFWICFSAKLSYAYFADWFLQFGYLLADVKVQRFVHYLVKKLPIVAQMVGNLVRN